MTRRIFKTILIFICLSSIAYGQKNIENNLTAQHQNIAGTKVSLIPPKGFIKGLNFLGLQQSESGSSIMVMDFPAPYSEVTKGLGEEHILSAGVEMKKIENFTLNGLPAIFVTETQNAYGNIYTKYVLIFGTEKETIMINGVFPENLKKIGAEIKKSMLTVVYEQNKIIDPFETLDFSIDVSGTKLKLGKGGISNILAFTVDGKIPT